MPNSAEHHLRRAEEGGGKRSQAARLTLRYILMVGIAVLMLGPFCWLFYLSIRMSGGIYEWPRGFGDFSLRGYKVVVRDFPIGQAFWNSVMAGVLSVLLTVAVASLAAYPLARLNFYGRNILFLALLSTMMVPFQLYMIPLFLLTSRTIHLSNTIVGVVLPFSASVFGIYLIKQFYATIPRDMEEAARVDGAGEFYLWWRVMFPLTKPAVATLAVFTFVGSWSGFLWPLIILQDDEKMTLPVALARLTGTFMESISYFAAGSVIAILPVIVFFLLLQRWFLGGMTVGAIKG